MFNPDRHERDAFESRESAPAYEVVAPPVETLLRPDAGSPWPEEILNDPDLKREASSRRETADRLVGLYEDIPDPTTDIEDAIGSGAASPEDAAAAYDKLSKLLESDPLNRRFVLYFPFELLPASDWKPDAAGLSSAAARFRDSYMKRWEEMLDFIDVRANFVDGDVLEPALRFGPLSRVTKAAHLIPKLVEKGLLDLDRVRDLASRGQHPALARGIADALPVLADMGLMSREEANEAAKNLERSSRAPAVSGPSSVSEARAAWLAKEEARRSLDEASEGVASDIIERRRAPAGTDQVTLHGVRKAVEKLAATDKERALEVRDSFEEALRAAIAGAPEARDAAINALSRWKALGVADEAYIAAFGIRIPEPGTPFSTSRDAVESEAKGIESAIAALESDPELSKYVYPAAILFGSRVKGYGSETADLDVAVFVRPGTPFEERSRVQELLKMAFSHEKVGGKVVEFWLDEGAAGRAIIDFPDPDASLGDSTWAHVLMEGAWCGNAETIKDMHAKLLSNYLRSEGKIVGGRSARATWLEEMERDTLQYRLMHKGYQRLYPERGGIHTEHSKSIDAESAFYDSGYRRLATKLYLEKVFLPTLRKR